MRSLQQHVALALLCLLLSFAARAQNIGINIDGSNPHPSAILDVKSDDKGLLVPRMTTVQRSAIPAPAEGLMVYDTTTDGFWVYTATGWELMTGDDGDWTVSGNYIYRPNSRLGIGATSPQNMIHLKNDLAGSAAIQFDAPETTTASGSRFSAANTGQSIDADVTDSWVGSASAAAASGGAYFTGGLVSRSGGNNLSDILRVTFNTFNTTIPSTAIITGYRVQVVLRASDDNDIVDFNVRLGVNSSQLGDNKARSSSFDWPTSFTSVYYGSSSDDWGTNISISNINSGDLTLNIQYEEDLPIFGGADEQGYVDYVRCTVYYEVPGSMSNSTWSAGNIDGSFVINDSWSLTSSPELVIEDDGVTSLKGLKLPTGAADGLVLTSNADGIGTWASLPSLPVDQVNDADANPTNELQNVIAGEGLVGGGNGLSTTLDVLVGNGLNVTSDAIRLGGDLNYTTQLSANNVDVSLSLLGAQSDLFISNDANSILRIVGTTGSFNFNPSNASSPNFILESASNANMFYMNSSTDRIGINELSPRSNFHVSSNSLNTYGQLLITEKTGNEGARVYFDNNVEFNNYWMMYARADNNANDNMFGFYSDAANDYILRMTGTKKVGVNIAPTYALHLPNDATDGLARAQVWSTYSDLRIKSSVKPLMSSLDRVLLLRPKSYQQHPSSFDSGKLEIDRSIGDERIGFIAQELYEVVPEAVQKPKDESEQLWGVDYTALIPLLTKAIQEQQELIENQQKLITDLQVISQSQGEDIRDLKQK